MDDTRFDRLARRLEKLTSRRVAVGGPAGTGLLAALGLEVVAKGQAEKEERVQAQVR